MKNTERSRLHYSKLDEYTAFCASCGYAACDPIKEACEVLRMYRPGEKGVLVVHRKLNAQHCTTWGRSEEMRIAYQTARRDHQ